MARSLFPTDAPRALPWSVVAGFVAVYLLLDWATFIRPLQGINITPWNPQPALAVALLRVDRRLWWVVCGTIFAADMVVRDLRGNALVAAAAAAALTGSYLVIVRALQALPKEGSRLRSRRDAGRLLLAIAGGSLLSAVAYVGTLTLGGVVPAGPWIGAVVRYWIGDGVGLLVTLPLILLTLDGASRARLAQTLRDGTWWLIAALAVLLLWVIFGPGAAANVKFFYLLLPVVWASTQFGTAGAVLMSVLTQVGLIAGLQLVAEPDLAVFELQLLMATVAATALLLGVVVDERERADEELRRTLRLAAAGQMSAALAHELSQPLTSLVTYAQACEMLASGPAATGPARYGQLVEVTRKMASDARRAGEVVRRLRDFFRSGSTQLQAVAIEPLIAEAIDAQRRRAEAAGIAITFDSKSPLPSIWIDPVQLQLVLRNLLANALDAAAGAPLPGLVTVRAEVAGAALLIEVTDSGPGVAAARVHTIFEQGGTDKADGMGVGLGICRAIVEAHGGRLWARAGARGHFGLTLPLDGDADAP